MSPFLILLAGMAVVIGGVLVLRLHAFLSLVLATLVVGLLTPHDLLLKHYLWSDSHEVVAVDGQQLSLANGKTMEAGDALLLRLTASLTLPEVVEVEVEPSDEEDKADQLTLSGTLPAAGDRMISTDAYAAANQHAGQGLGARLAGAFGDTCGKIGILIAMAAIIGKCLLDSGAAERIVLAAQNLFGVKHTPMAFLGSGFVVGIPVFFDTVFYLLLPLGKAMRVKTGKHYLLYVLTIVAGATMAHSLVPPTPGPLFVASELGVDLGLMMIGGLLVGLWTILFGYLYALWADRRWDIPLRPSAELTDEELQAMAHRDPAELPPLWVSLLPIVLPVALIAGGTAVNMIYADADKPAWSGPLLRLADKNIALCLSAAIAIIIYAVQKRPSRSTFAGAMQSALASGGVIILITAAGGAFGAALADTGIAEAIRSAVPRSNSPLLWLPIAFAITTTVRIAQGSATVAMITAVGIVAPIAAGGAMGFSPLYLALAIGCGSKPIPWMNDSGFWLISKMSGMTEGETLKTASVMMSLMGVAGLVATIIAAVVLPLQ